MPETPKIQLPYPAATDPADVPTDMRELANRIDAIYGEAGGIASLGPDGKVPAAQIPTIVSGELAYAQITSPVSILGSTTQIVAAPPVTPAAGQVIVVEFGCGDVTIPAGAGSAIVISLWRNSAPQSQFGVVMNNTAQAIRVPVYLSQRLTGLTGPQTFVVQAQMTAGTGTIAAGSGAGSTAAPTWLRIGAA